MIPTKSNNASEIDLAYCAATMDGEGCFCIGKSSIKARRASPYWYLVVSVIMTEIGAIECLISCFGGKALFQKRKEGKDVWEWKRWGDDALHVARTVLPYLRIKTRQAKLAIDFQEYMQANRYRGPKLLTQEEKDTRDYFRMLMGCLND